MATHEENVQNLTTAVEALRRVDLRRVPKDQRGNVQTARTELGTALKNIRPR